MPINNVLTLFSNFEGNLAHQFGNYGRESNEIQPPVYFSTKNEKNSVGFSGHLEATADGW